MSSYFKSNFMGSILVCLLATATFGATNTQQLACYFYDQDEAKDGSIPSLAMVWAKGYRNEQIFVVGEMRGGFFYVETIEEKSQKLFGSKLHASYESSYALAEDFCMQAIRLKFKENYRKKELLHFGIKPMLLSLVYTPLVFVQKKEDRLKELDKLVVFGDSLSDQNNLKNFLRAFPSDKHYFAGRLSNGMNWLDHMQKINGIAVQNWAVAGAKTNGTLELDFKKEPLVSILKRRIRAFAAGTVEDQVAHYKEQSTDQGHIVDAASTLFCIWAGGNDYLSIVERIEDVDVFLDNPEDPRIGSKLVVKRVVGNIATQIKELYKMGALNFLIAGLPDLGKIPKLLENKKYHYRLEESRNDRIFFLSQKMTAVANQHNQMLMTIINTLKQELPNITIGFADISQGMEHVLNLRSLENNQVPFNYDLNEEMREQFSYQGQTVFIEKPCLTFLAYANFQICKEPNKSLFYDRTHPSRYGHCLLGWIMHDAASQRGFFNKATAQEYLELCRPGIF